MRLQIPGARVSRVLLGAAMSGLLVALLCLLPIWSRSFSWLLGANFCVTRAALLFLSLLDFLGIPVQGFANRTFEFATHIGGEWFMVEDGIGLFVVAPSLLLLFGALWTAREARRRAPTA